MSLSYKSKLFINFFAVFLVFTVVLLVFQYHREVEYRKGVIENRLRSYADIYANILDHKVAESRDRFVVMKDLMPRDLRLTVIDRKGNVIYESCSEYKAMNNHLNRPEVKAALQNKEGLDIRYSKTENKEFLYFAKNYRNCVVRVSMPYNNKVQNFMKADNIFLWVVLLSLPIVFFLLIYLSDHFGKTLSMLRLFVTSAERGLVDYDHISFPHSELGNVGRTVLQKYKALDESNRQAERERERLIRHFFYFEEGIAIFTPARKSLYANPHFLQYVNMLLEKTSDDMSCIWDLPAFQPVAEFLTQHCGKNKMEGVAPLFRYIQSFGSLIVSIQVVIYTDKSFEITLTNVTEAEKEKELKQKMSNNITHELRTPVSSVRGYIETLLANPEMEKERRMYFLRKADAQAERLTNLIRDVALITKVDEAPNTLSTEQINVKSVVEDIVEEFQDKIKAKGATIENMLKNDLKVTGNYSLIYSIFRNLMENSLNYGGKGITIHVECYRKDEDFCFFDFYDSGKGVSDEHLPYLFERFYRVQEGRTRNDGGTGLGLSIVRNAVKFHGGDISVCNRKTNGLEFLFTLKR